MIAGGAGGEVQRGRRRQGGSRIVAQERSLETQCPEGETSGSPPLRPPTRQDQEAAMG